MPALNPELRRSLWLHATPRKLAFAGAVLAGVFAAVWLLDRGRHAYAVTLAGAVVFCISALGWAPRAARNAITGEAQGGTWDAQRLSALTPWAMTWGKLAGATARPWATAAGGLTLAALQLASTSSLRHAGFWVLVALGLAATLQASGLATGLIDVRRARASGRPLSLRAPGLLLLVLTLLSLAVLVWVRARVGDALGRLEASDAQLTGAQASGAQPPVLAVSWYGHVFTPLAFAVPTLLALAAWALVWAWRLMRLELGRINAPWAWAGFLGCAGLYAFGFQAPAAAPSPLAARLASVGAVWAALAYMGAFSEPADRVRARQFAAALAGRKPLRLLSHLPLPALPGMLALCAGAAVAIIRARQGDAAVALGVLAALAFLLRDLGIIAWRRFAGRARQGDAGVLLLLLILYACAPLARLSGGLRGQALFLPTLAEPRLGLCAAGLEAALAWLLAAASVAHRPAPPWRPAVLPSAPPARPSSTSVPVTPPPPADAAAA